MAVFPVQPRAVLFDMDGVLVHSERVWHQLLMEAAARFGAPPMSWEAFLPTFGQGADADIEHFGFQCTHRDLEAYFSDNFGRFVSHVQSNPEAAPLLEVLRSAGVKCAVVTNSMTHIAKQVLTQAALAPFFDSVACADAAGRPKPEPDVVHLALKTLGVSPEEAVMVGDSRFDRGAAAAARVRFAGLRLDGDVRLERLGELLGHLTLR